MQIMRYFPETETTEDYPDTGIGHVDRDSEEQVTLYTTGGEFYLTLSKQDIDRINTVFAGKEEG